MPRLATRYVFDSVSLSNFALADGLGVLRMRYDRRGLITPEVRVEIEHGLDAGYDALSGVLGLLRTGCFREKALTLKERQSYIRWIRTLGSGEASCIALAEGGHVTVVTDDRAARMVCRDVGVTVTGTLGILVACCRDESMSVDAADRLLSRMIDTGFYSPVGRVRDVL